ncbi:sulfotransferase family protein [Aspergillus ibericus CBS 121593]|uniref:NAD dependent epimerase/dehydratase n=1 Tax=Aspergillus ibericus CBS 121593 TaxID=1448316 RepID=A0A395HCF6_9EURO|nr:hypothetical protein BO80DRAFT_348997 [Aspergillus ibericus CBS 121593]RAL03914.1 hypothetical protein BO80DRAFT_348997 [Aspergillus ibericus CBS 121593]
MDLIKTTLYGFPKPPPRVCTKPLRVICTGLPRSATESLSTALEQLGYQPYHGWDLVFDSPGYIQEWAALARRKYDGAPDGDFHATAAEFDALLGDHDAVLDSVPAMFAAELIEAYPDAKVVMNTRSDLDAWHQSMMKTLVAETEGSWKTWFVSTFNAEMFWLWEAYYTYAYVGLFRAPKGKTASRGIEKNGKWVYRDHCNMVRGMVSKDRLLEWSVEDGWGPLCEFLGEKVPDEPFPKGNNPAAFKNKIAEKLGPRVRGAMINIALTATSVGVIGIVLGFAVKERGVPWKTIGGVSSAIGSGWAVLTNFRN